MIDGTPSLLSVAGSDTNQAKAINNLNDCVGFYYDGNVSQGFFRRNADASVDYPISAPGWPATYLYGINDLGWMVGSVVNAQEPHGLNPAGK